MDLSKIKKELINNNEFYNSDYNNYTYRNSINLLLNHLIDYDLINNYEIKNNEIIIHCFDKGWIHLYSNRTCLLCVKIEKIIIYNDYRTIRINDNLLLNLSELLFNFYEFYYG